MAQRRDWGTVGIDVTTGSGTTPREIGPDSPFRMLIAGDFSGRANRGERAPATRAIEVDRDNYDEVMASLGTAIQLPVIGKIEFRELDDFHPDRLYDRLRAFQVLREQRGRLNDPDRYRAAAADQKRVSEPARGVREHDVVAAASASLLDAAVEASATRGTGAAPSRHADPFEAMLRDLVAPYAVPNPDPKQVELVAQVDRATQEVMRTILHHPAFQSLEAAWRGLYQLVKSVDTGERLKIYIADISKNEASSEFATATDLKQTALFRLTAGKGYAIAAANFSIGLNMDDLSLIGRMALIAREAECSWIAHGEATLAGCPAWVTTPDPDDWEEPEATEEWQMWQAIRRLPESACIGLASPRMLLRMPYGKKAETTERIEFEEMPAKPNHAWFLWGNPLFACLQLMGTAFFEDGWHFHPDAYRQIDRLPMYTYVDSGETVIQPVAEAVLSDQAAERMMECGLMPLLSEKHGDAALLARWQSIHQPIAALAGRWGR